MQESAEHSYAWRPDPAQVAASVQTAFLRAEGLAAHEDLAAKAQQDPGWLWDAVIRFADLRFYRPYERIMDDAAGAAWTKWCVGGTTNHVLNCIERHRNTPVMDRTFALWEGEDGSTRTLQWSAFDEQVCRMAGGLAQLGIQRGDAVALLMPALPETFVAYFAILKLGAVAAPLFSGFGPAAIADRISLVGAKAVVTAASTQRRGKTLHLKQTLDEALEHAPSVESVVVVDEGCAPAPMRKPRDVRFCDLLSASPPLAETAAMACDEPAVVHFTSGTTGRPKGCVYTHIGLAAKMAFDHGILTDFRSSDRHFCMADMGWMVGSKSATIPTLHGGSMIIAEGVPDYPDPGRIWRIAAKHKATWMELSPSVARAQMQHPSEHTGGHDLSALRIIVTGGEAWQDKPWLWLQRQCPNAAILDSAGGTEVSGSILLCDLHHPVRIGAFSIAIPGMQALVVGEDGAPAAAGQMGELAMGGSSIGLTAGLYGEPERYEESYWSKYPGLWAHGDLCSRDEHDGYWRLHGRIDDTIKIAGKRIGPAEIEQAAMASGAVAECSAVEAVAADGSAVIAVAAVASGAADAAAAEQLRAAVGRELGRSFVPRDVYFVAMLPKTRSQKIMRRKVRAAICGQEAGDVSMLHNPESIAMLRAAAAKD